MTNYFISSCQELKQQKIMWLVSCGSGCTYYRGRRTGALKERTDREACLQQVMALKKQAQEKERERVANWKKRPNKRNGRDFILISCQHIHVIG